MSAKVGIEGVEISVQGSGDGERFLTAFLPLLARRVTGPSGEDEGTCTTALHDAEASEAFGPTRLLRTSSLRQERKML